MRTTALSIIILVTSLQLMSGADDIRVFMRVNGSEVTVSEFTRLFERNRTDGERQSINEYLEHFTLYRLKVAYAMSAGLQNEDRFINELKGYRQQVAMRYLTDSELFEEMVQRSYERMRYEINASHILIGLPPAATAADTMAAWQRAVELTDRIRRGESFSSLAVEYSDDPSAADNGGELGYFTAMQMVLPFEEAAYNLRPGEISQPVRTSFGYHIIRINSRIGSRGSVKVAHIMKALSRNAGEEEIAQREKEIWDIYNRITAGETFAELAREKSDHRESAATGGELAWFRTGEIVPEFAEAAFRLNSNGEISEPVRTIYGWHIIKRIDRREPEGLEELRPFIEYSLSNSEVSRVAKRSFVEKLKKEYRYRIDASLLGWFIAEYSRMAAEGNIRFSEVNIPSGVVFSFEGGELTSGELAQALESRPITGNRDGFREYLSAVVEEKAAEMLLAHEDSRLEHKHPEFRYLMKEYHDGILLFEVTADKIWNRAYSDTLGLQQFYGENIDLFTGPASAKGKRYSTSEKGDLRLLSRLIRRYGGRDDGEDAIISLMKRRRDARVTITGVHLVAGEEPLADRFIDGELRLNAPHIYDDTSIIVIDEILPPLPEEPDSAMNKIVSLYQEELERRWHRQLKESYSVWIDEKILQELMIRYNEK